LKFLEATVNEMEKGILQNSYNLEYLTRVIELYSKIAVYEPAFIYKAESLIKACIRVNPKYEWLYYALADIYKLKKEYVAMFEIVKSMATLDPDNDQKQLKLALAAIFLKKENIATHAFDEIRRIRKTMNADNASGKTPAFEMNEFHMISKAYLEVKDFQSAIYYLNQIIIINPNRADVHYDLANAYLNLGDKTNALKEVKKAAELDPLTYGGISEKYRFIK